MRERLFGLLARGNVSAVDRCVRDAQAKERATAPEERRVFWQFFGPMRLADMMVAMRRFVPGIATARDAEQLGFSLRYAESEAILEALGFDPDDPYNPDRGGRDWVPGEADESDALRCIVFWCLSTHAAGTSLGLLPQ